MCERHGGGGGRSHLDIYIYISICYTCCIRCMYHILYIYCACHMCFYICMYDIYVHLICYVFLSNSTGKDIANMFWNHAPKTYLQSLYSVIYGQSKNFLQQWKAFDIKCLHQQQKMFFQSKILWSTF